MPLPPHSWQRHLPRLLQILAAIGMLRVFLCAAAFPFWNNVDEEAHVDVVLKFARGEWPSPKPQHYGEEAIQFGTLFQSPEFLQPPLPGADGTLAVPAPIWTQPIELAQTLYKRRQEILGAAVNSAAYTPPLYYLLAGAWFRLGEGMGFSGGQLLYWVRFLNLLGFAVFFRLAVGLCGAMFPGRDAWQLALGCLLAVFPQDVWYSVNNDALSPVVCTAFWWAAWTSFSRPGAVGSAALAGFLAALCLWTKYSNVHVLPVLWAVEWARWRRRGLDVQDDAGRAQNVHRDRYALATAAAVLACALPLGSLVVWNRMTVGDFSGTGPRLAALGWTVRPWHMWLDHPLFTPRGLGYFVYHNLVSFWRGEFFWHGVRLATTWADVVYFASTAMLVGISSIAACVWPPADARQRWVLRTAAGCVAAGLMFLAVLSLAYDFGRCVYPSREAPFFVSGRLLSGVVVPLLLLYLEGLARVMKALRCHWLPAAAIVVVCAVCLVSEARLTAPVLTSPYNWFHVPAQVEVRVNGSAVKGTQRHATGAQRISRDADEPLV